MIRDAIILQKREIESKSKEKYIERDIKHIDLNSNMIKVIIGPRRAGKSFFAMRELNKKGAFGYVNFDDESLSKSNNYNEIVEGINSVYNAPHFILFDEIQNLSDWELFVNRLQRQGYNLVLTGSNSNLLSKELSTHLTGRHIPIIIFPLSFKEYLKKDNKERVTAEIKNKLLDYLTYGGYPEPLIKNINYKEYLSTLFDSIIYIDIVKRFKIRSPNAIENLAKYLVSNAARDYSYNALAKLTKCKSPHTVEKYLNYLEEAFIFCRINRFSFKLKKQFPSNKKIYCIDNGFIHAKSFKLSPNYGWLYENCVAIELKKLEYLKKAEIYFWKNVQQEEVDFVIKEGTKITKLIQVCYDVNDNKTKEREIRALLKAGKQLGCKNLLIITNDYEAEENSEWFGIKGKIKYIPLWKWLLEEKKQG